MSELFGRNLTQGLITLNNGVDIDYFRQRKRDAMVYGSSAKPSTLEIFPGGEDDANLVICQAELAIAHRRRNQKGKSRLVPFHIFTSFNGMVYHDLDLDELADSLVIVGTTKGTYNQFDGNHGNIGVATVFAGTSDLRYNAPSGVRAYPGDLIKWRIPSPDPVALNKEGLPTFKDFPRSKLVPIIEPLEWDNLKFRLENVAANAYRSSLSSFRPGVPNTSNKLTDILESSIGGSLRKGPSQVKMSNAEREALYYKASTVVSVMRAIEVLVGRGLLKIMTPEKKQKDEYIKRCVDGTDQFDPDTYRGITKTSIEDLTGLSYDTNDGDDEAGDDSSDNKDVINGSFVHDFKWNATSDELSEQLNDILFLSAILGMTRSKKIPLSLEAQKDVVYASSWPHVTKVNLENTKITAYHGYEPLSQHKDFVGDNNKEGNSLYSTYLEMSMRAPLGRIKAYEEIISREKSKVIGTCLSHGDPNTVNPMIDILLHRYG